MHQFWQNFLPLFVVFYSIFSLLSRRMIRELLLVPSNLKVPWLQFANLVPSLDSHLQMTSYLNPSLLPHLPLSSNSGSNSDSNSARSLTHSTCSPYKMSSVFARSEVHFRKNYSVHPQLLLLFLT